MRRIGLRRSAALAAIAVAAVLMLPVSPARADTAPVLFVSNMGNRVVALSTPTQLFPSYVFLGCESDEPIVSWTFQLFDSSGAFVRTIVAVAQQECTPTRAAYAPFDGTDAAGNRLPDGTYTLRATATDFLGLTGTRDAQFDVDTRIPGYLVSPGSGAVVTGKVALNVFPAHSTQVKEVDYTLSGCGQTTGTPAPPGVFSGVLDVSACPTGPQTLSTTIEWVDAYGEFLFYEFDTAVVVGPILQSTAAPVVRGKPLVGLRLSATAGTWSPRKVSVSFQWLSDGVAIPGAIGSTYFPVAADVGKRLSVAVTASKAGYSTNTAVSAPSDVVGLGRARISPSPSVDGAARVGSTLLGYGGTSSPGPLTISWQWLRGRTAITGATGHTYTLVAADAGARIRLRLTASGPGYVPTTATSPATARVEAT